MVEDEFAIEVSVGPALLAVGVLLGLAEMSIDALTGPAMAIDRGIFAARDAWDSLGEWFYG